MADLRSGPLPTGPVTLAAALLCVALFSEPFWQNFFLLKADSLNVTMKAGAWGVCTRLRVRSLSLRKAHRTLQTNRARRLGLRFDPLQNNTGVSGPSTWVSLISESVNGGGGSCFCRLPRPSEPLQDDIADCSLDLQCTSKMSGYDFNFVLNATGINQFVSGRQALERKTELTFSSFAQPTEANDAILLGTTGVDSISILTSGQTSMVWVHVIGALDRRSWHPSRADVSRI